MNRPRILFRADASHAIGFGHVARLCALIEEVAARGGEPIVMFGGDPEPLSSWARDRGLAAGIGAWSAQQVAHFAEEQRVSAAIVDGPALVEELVPRLLEQRIPTVALDDRGGLTLAATAIVNHNYHAPALARGYATGPRLLLGRRYMLLRREIRRYTRGSCRPMSGSRLRVIVTFGGSDPPNATARTLGNLPAERPLELVVIAGPGYRDDQALRAAAAQAVRAGHTVDLRRSPDDPGALFVSADAAICSAGGTLGELAYLGCPAAGYAIAEDQRVPASHQAADGLIDGGLVWSEASDDELRASLARFLQDEDRRHELRQRALATADGDGPRRVLDETFA